jgi:hypothetical protein
MFHTHRKYTATLFVPSMRFGIAEFELISTRLYRTSEVSVMMKIPLVYDTV